MNDMLTKFTIYFWCGADTDHSVFVLQQRKWLLLGNKLKHDTSWIVQYCF
jgi:hypothetical protein